MCWKIQWIVYRKYVSITWTLVDQRKNFILEILMNFSWWTRFCMKSNSFNINLLYIYHPSCVASYSLHFTGKYFSAIIRNSYNFSSSRLFYVVMRKSNSGQVAWILKNHLFPWFKLDSTQIHERTASLVAELKWPVKTIHSTKPNLSIW